jgi:pimeloyl-ACP methyl ester carboxylesterase
MAIDKTSQTIKLKDGRLLGYAEYGAPEGKPVFFFHGWIGSRLDFRPNDAIAYSLGARVIAIDRPGCGLSDFKPSRAILDWPDDVIELADGLGIDQFAVSGHSFGGPYVTACAYKIPDRLTAAGIIAGIGPLNRPGATKGLPIPTRLALWMAGHAPLFLMKPYVWQMFLLTRQSKILWKGLLSQLPKAEVEIVSRPEFAGFPDGMSEMFRSGKRGALWDARVFTSPWEFRVEGIRMKVHLWYGEADRNVPLQMGEYYKHAIPKCDAMFYPGEGHFIMYSRAEEILRTLIS